jgi:DNA invertase Pin-like site-specific DNA recombinase
MASIGEMERNRIKSRTAEGIAIGKAQGKFKGRKLGSTQSDEKLLERHQTIQKKLQKGLTVREINEITGASSATIIKVKKVMSKRKMI